MPSLNAKALEALKPCPFCGGEAERVDIEDGDNAGGSFVHCTRCDASGNVEFEFKENFISNWNRRALSALPQAGTVSEEMLTVIRQHVLVEAGDDELRAALEAALSLRQQEEAVPVALTYTNYKGETATRTITPRSIWFGSTEWHPEPQYLLRAFDHDKQGDRDFALKDFGRAVPEYAGEPFPQPKRKDGGEPCGECHIRSGETCDICGAAQADAGEPTKALSLDEVAEEARRYASFYPEASDGRNTFIIFAEWIERRVPATSHAKGSSPADMVDLHIVFQDDGGPANLRFVEIENLAGKSVRAGAWFKRDDGYDVLSLSVHPSNVTPNGAR